MSREEILEKLREIAVKMDERYADTISAADEDTELLRDLGFSSIQMLFLAVLLEETFQIRLRQLNELHLVTLGDVIDLVERHISDSGAEA